jgi:hypothetical protein
VSEKNTCANCGARYDPEELGLDPRSNTCSDTCKRQWRARNRFVAYRVVKDTGMKENAVFQRKYIIYRRSLVKKLCIKILGNQAVKKFLNRDFDEIGKLIQKNLASDVQTLALRIQGEDVLLKYLNTVKREVLAEIFSRISSELEKIKKTNETRESASN